jgi:hypothetical protein
MDQQIKLYRVFIASPGDLADERKALRDLVERINGICSKETDWRIELLGWEDTLPGTGRPQELINADLDKADLFIGCLWQRWGTPSGDGNKTGFEEEFTRSFEKYKTTGSPEIWLFFKEVEPIRLSDPGEQLQKVLAFRSAQIEAKQLFFKEFKEARDWRELVHDLLLRRTLQLITSKSVTGKGVQSTTASQGQAQGAETTEGTPKPQSKSGKAFTSLAEVLKITHQKVEAGKLLAFNDSEPLASSESARLLLFATTNYDWHEQRSPLGTHEINSVYWHREALSPTNQERIFLLRTVLVDDSLTKPGWFWLHTRKLPLRVWLSYFIESNTGDSAQEMAVKLATRIKFSLHKPLRKHGRLITSILDNRNKQVRLAGLNYLASNGTLHEIQDVERLLSDGDKDVRTSVERTKRIIELRANPDGELRKSIQQGDSFDDEIIASLLPLLATVTDETLQIALKHSNGAVRSFGAQELLTLA